MKRLALLILILSLLIPIAPIEAQTTIVSVQSGNWSAPSTWMGGIVPGAANAVTIVPNHVVTYNVASAMVVGITVDGELRFAPSTVTLQTNKNVIVNGKLTMRPSAANIVHTLRFINVNEAAFVGGGMVPLATDVGLWVMGNGILDAQGTPKTAWLHTAGSVAQGSANVALDVTPQGWQVGDAIAIAPTSPTSVGTAFWNGFSTSGLNAINGATVTLNQPTPYPHPSVSNPFTATVYTAEVLNLSRNVKIEGTATGRSHVFIRSTLPQTIRYVELRYMGVPNVLGRYGLHFHMMGDSSRGSLVEGVVIRDTGAHAFVPHASHGITLFNTIAYFVTNDAYWWDPPECNNGCPDTNDSHDIVFDHAVAAKVVPLASGSTRMAGFVLGKGNGNIIRDSVAVGVQGTVDSAGYIWPELGHGVWTFQNNVAHNNKMKNVFVWQNNFLDHQVNGLVAYNSPMCVDQGAYRNGYEYFDLYLLGCDIAINSRASSGGQLRPDDYIQAFERVYANGSFRIAEHNLPYLRPTLVKDAVFTSIVIDEHTKDTPGQYDFVNVTKANGASIEPGDFLFEFAWLASIYRVQRPDGTAWQVTGGQVYSNIAPFYGAQKAAVSMLMYMPTIEAGNGAND